MNNPIAYSGQQFCIEWYHDSTGKSQALEYFKKLSVEERIQVLKLFKRIGDSGKIFDTTKFNYEGDQIYAFKPQPERFLCFFYNGKRIIVTNAFRKKQQKLPSNQKEMAIRNRADYILRNK